MDFYNYSPFESIDLFGGSDQSYLPPEPQPYEDPYANYENPYANDSDPYADFGNPYSDIDLLSAQRGAFMSPMFGAPMQYAQGPMPSQQPQEAPMPEPEPSGIASIAPPQPVDEPTFFAGDRSFDSRQAAIDYARNELQDPDAVQFVGAGQTRPPQMTAEEKRVAEERRLEGLRRFEESKRRVEEFKARKQGLVDQYSGRDVEGGYGLEGRGFENVRFRDLDEAMAALRALNAPGADPNNLAVSYDRLVNMGGGPMFTVSQGVNQNRLDVPRFTNREQAIEYLMKERGMNRARAGRNVRQRG